MLHSMLVCTVAIIQSLIHFMQMVMGSAQTSFYWTDRCMPPAIIVSVQHCRNILFASLATEHATQRLFQSVPYYNCKLFKLLLTISNQKQYFQDRLFELHVFMTAMIANVALVVPSTITGVFVRTAILEDRFFFVYQHNGFYSVC